MKAIEQYVLVVLFIMPYKVVLTFKSADKSLAYDHSNESNWAHFHVVLLIMLYKVVLTSSVYETLVCDQSKESYWAVLSCGTVYYAVQGGSINL